MPRQSVHELKTAANHDEMSLQELLRLLPSQQAHVLQQLVTCLSVPDDVILVMELIRRLRLQSSKLQTEHLLQNMHAYVEWSEQFGALDAAISVLQISVGKYEINIKEMNALPKSDRDHNPVLAALLQYLDLTWRNDVRAVAASMLQTLLLLGAMHNWSRVILNEFACSLRDVIFRASAESGDVLKALAGCHDMESVVALLNQHLSSGQDSVKPFLRSLQKLLTRHADIFPTRSAPSEVKQTVQPVSQREKKESKAKRKQHFQSILTDVPELQFQPDIFRLPIDEDSDNTAIFVTVEEQGSHDEVASTRSEQDVYYSRNWLRQMAIPSQYHTSCFTPSERMRIIAYLEKELRKEPAAGVLILMFCLGQELETVLQLRLGQDILEENNDYYLLRTPRFPAQRFEPSADDAEFFVPGSDTFRLQLPEVVADFCKSASLQYGKTICESLAVEMDQIIEQVQQTLIQMRKFVPRRIYLSRFVAQLRLTLQSQSVSSLATYLLSSQPEDEYITAIYYCSFSEEQLQKFYDTAVRQIFAPAHR